MLWQREDVNDLLESAEVSEGLKIRLQLSQEIRSFASQTLHLPVGDAYSSYSDLKRPYVVWNVYAAPALSFESYTWCYPILGCLAYRGFYEEARAKQVADELEEEGYDVKVGGVRAYSTLGFFADPLLNTFIYQNEVALVELLIHEIAHRQIYIKDDTKFNENFASAVASIGAEQWYRLQNNQELYEAYQQQKIVHQELVDFLLLFKLELTEIYTNTEISEAQKLEQKLAKFQSLFKEYDAYKKLKQLDNRYDNWVLSMNNASLSTLANYQELVPGFIALFEQQTGDWQKFYLAVKALSQLEKELRHQTLKDLGQLNVQAEE